MLKIIIFLICVKTILSAIDTTVWNYQLWLDPYEKYSLKWNINSETQTITFLCEVRTRGWIGFGVSPNGGMIGSDVIIAWIDDSSGITYFKDRYASSESTPEIDESQDWILIDSKQNSTHTSIQFSRPLITCDRDYDRDITRETTRLVYAYSDSDPKTETDIKIHGRHQRGGKSVLLLSHTESKEREPNETDLKTFVLNVKNITIPKKGTTLWCKIFKLPEEKIHVVKYKPYITAQNEPFVHHTTVSACYHPNPQMLDQYLNDEGSDCTEKGLMPKDFSHCFNYYFMWAVGAGAFSLPPDVGFPLGTDMSTTYLLINTHYDNPELIEGIVDSSGLEFYYTKQFRKYEAFTMSLGLNYDTRMFIPPRQSAFHISGHCTMDCFENNIDPDGLNAFAYWPHEHLLGRKLKTRHFRGNKELKWLGYEENYDVNLQSFRLLDPMVKIKSGDQLSVECEYDSTLLNKTVFGGWETRDEMCTAFIFYYPKIQNSKHCLSGFTEETMRTLADIKPDQQFRTQSDFINYLRYKQDWNQTVLNNSYNIMLNAKQNIECYLEFVENIEYKKSIGYPVVDQLYKPEEIQCLSYSAQSSQSSSASNVWIFIVIAIIIALIVGFGVYFYRRTPRNRPQIL